MNDDTKRHGELWAALCSVVGYDAYVAVALAALREAYVGPMTFELATNALLNAHIIKTAQASN